MEVQFYFIILFFLVILGLIFFSFYFEKKRTQQLEQLMKLQGFSFQKEGDQNILNEQFKLFSVGHSHRVYNLSTGTRSHFNLKIFDYKYTVGGGKNSHTYNQTAIIVESKNQLPDFSLSTESFFHKIGDLFGFKDIDFVDYPNFSKMYLLKGSNEDSIRKLFRPEVLQYLEQNKTNATIEASGNKILYYESGKRTKPQEMTQFIEKAITTLNLFLRD